MLNLIFLIVTLVRSYDGKSYCNPVRGEYKQPSEEYKIKYVQTIARHGDRSPDKSYDGDDGHYECNSRQESHVYMENGKKASHASTYREILVDKENNPYASDYYFSGSCQTGQLTHKGTKQQFELGKMFRNIYYDKMHLIPEIYDPNTVKVRASGKVRTLESAQAFMQTFYPIEKRGSETSVEINSQPYDIETLKPNPSCCPIINTLQNGMLNYDDIKSRRSEPALKSALEKFQKITGLTNSHANLYDQMDLLTERVCNDLKFPCKGDLCITQDDYNKIFDEYVYENKYFFGANVSKYQLGFFATEMLDDSIDAIANKVVYQHYSGHDTSIMGMLDLIGENTQIVIPYASTLVFEYYTKNDVLMVRALLNNNALDLSNLCSVTDGFCTFDEFNKNLRAKTPEYSECFPTEQPKTNAGIKLSRKGWYTRN